MIGGRPIPLVVLHNIVRSRKFKMFLCSVSRNRWGTFDHPPCVAPVEFSEFHYELCFCPLPGLSIFSDQPAIPGGPRDVQESFFSSPSPIVPGLDTPHLYTEILEYLTLGGRVRAFHVFDEAFLESFTKSEPF